MTVKMFFRIDKLSSKEKVKYFSSFGNFYASKIFYAIIFL